MRGPSALQLALDLHRMPTLAAAARRTPVPSDIMVLIQIVGGSNDAMDRAVNLTGAGRDRIHAAAAFFIQQVLLESQGDHYRVLGVPRDADSALIGQHARGLLKWLHPDRDASSWDSTLATRVLSAWAELKDPLRRAGYDRSLQTVGNMVERSGRANTGTDQQRGARTLVPWIRIAKERTGHSRGLVRRMARGLTVAVAGFVVLCLPLAL
jgi:hypothetical protein